ncbi:ATP-binding protein [Streptomyces lonarensis]|uniref:ATP-binding protein n=1 Tax=Streptomyces lonarensis TaxID=700599 RepID=A0A7X6D3B6_9ACTN|nr:ATP-binding protein [Streptomyces lonarensis]
MARHPRRPAEAVARHPRGPAAERPSTPASRLTPARRHQNCPFRDSRRSAPRTPGTGDRDTRHPIDHRQHEENTVDEDTPEATPRRVENWDDGVIARRARVVEAPPPPEQRTSSRVDAYGEEFVPEPEPVISVPAPARPGPAPTEDTPPTRADHELADRLTALKELVGLSRTRLDASALAEAGRLLDEADSRTRLPRACTTVAVAGATGSGKSTLFNALAGAQLSEAGVRRPTTATAVSCTWEAGRSSRAEGLLDRLGVPVRSRRRAHLVDPGLHGLVLLDLPDYDSVASEHREQVDRLLALVDAVIWVVDPEKYADAVLHERYLRAFAGHAEVTVMVLNQIDRLPADAAEAIMDDLRGLLDDRGIALGEHGEPGAAVLAVSALTGEGVPDLRQTIGELVRTRTAAARRLGADLDGVTRRLRPVCVADSVQAPTGLTPQAREEFEERLAHAVGAPAAGRAAERGWLRRSERACGTPWAQLTKRIADRRASRRGEPPALSARAGRLGEPPVVSRPVIAEAVRTVAATAATELPGPWAKAVRDAAWRGAERLPAALEAALAARPGFGPEAAVRPGPARPAWWTVAIVGQALLMTAQLLGMCWLLTAAFGYPVAAGWLPAGLLIGGSLGAPLLAWACRVASRGPARAWGQREEERLRRVAAGCGRSLVLEPVAAELLRYREVREQFVAAAGGEPR